MNGMDMLGGMMGAMAGAMPPMPEDSNIIDAEAREVETFKPYIINSEYINDEGKWVCDSEYIESEDYNVEEHYPESDWKKVSDNHYVKISNYDAWLEGDTNVERDVILDRWEVDKQSSTLHLMPGQSIYDNYKKDELVRIDKNHYCMANDYDKCYPFGDIPTSDIIRTATPFIINTAESNGKFVATLTFLCVLEDDSIITISRNYVINQIEDKDVIELIDFHAEQEFINNKICYNYIAKYLPSYYTPLHFTTDDLHSKVVKLPCIKINDRKDKDFYMNPEVYACMNFIDDYVFNGEVENTYDLQLATVAGSKPNNNVEFFVIDSIETIVSMVSTTKKPTGLDKIKNLFSKDESTSIGLVFRASRFINGEKDIVTILTPFDIGVVLDKSKFKGDTIESLQETYYGDSDQYVGTLMVDDSHLYGIDKSYLMIRGKNKTGITKIFLLDTNIKTDLIHKIKEY